MTQHTPETCGEIKRAMDLAAEITLLRQDKAELLEALIWALGVIEICEENAPDIDWSIGHFGRKARAQTAIAKAGKGS